MKYLQSCSKPKLHHSFYTHSILCSHQTKLVSDSFFNHFFQFLSDSLVESLTSYIYQPPWLRWSVVGCFMEVDGDATWNDWGKTWIRWHVSWWERGDWYWGVHTNSDNHHQKDYKWVMNSMNWGWWHSDDHDVMMCSVI